MYLEREAVGILDVTVIQGYLATLQQANESVIRYELIDALCVAIDYTRSILLRYVKQ